MTYTIKDDKGNMICSIENVDPVRSSEELSADGFGAILVGSAAALSLGAIGFVYIKDKIRINKINKILGKEKLEFAKKYEQECTKCRSDFYKFAKSNLNILTKAAKSIDKNVTDIICDKYEYGSWKTYKNHNNIDEFEVGIEIFVCTKNADITYNKLNKIFNEIGKELAKFKTKFKLKRIYVGKESEINGDGDSDDFSWWGPVVLIFEHDKTVMNDIINPIKKYLR